MGQENQCLAAETCCQQTRKDAIYSKMMAQTGQKPTLVLPSRIPDKAVRESVLKTSYPYFSSVGAKQIKLPGGKTYSGQLDSKGVPNGYGELLEGETYKMGYFKDGQLDGVGRVATWGNKPCSFIGEFKKDEPLQGSLQQEGHKYEGPLVNGQPEGQGKLWTSEGNFFQGKLAKGSPADGKYMYQLHPKIKTFNGPLSKTQTRLGQIAYKDNQSFKGLLQGQKLKEGEYEYGNGDRYSGGFVNGLRQGYGKYFYAKEGVSYQGEFLQNLKHGKGCLTYQNGDVLNGLWENGELKDIE